MPAGAAWLCSPQGRGPTGPGQAAAGSGGTLGLSMERPHLPGDGGRTSQGLRRCQVAKSEELVFSERPIRKTQSQRFSDC